MRGFGAKKRGFEFVDKAMMLTRRKRFLIANMIAIDDRNAFGNNECLVFEVY